MAHFLVKNLLSLLALMAVSLYSNAQFIGRELPRQTERPNVVLILIDDLSHYGVSAYGANRIRSLNGSFPDQIFSTPNIDDLARNGLRFNNAFAHPLCENTRISLMSGMSNNRNYLQPKSQHASDITFGDTFKRAGYTTGLFGKWKQTRGTREIPGKEYIAQFGWDEYVAFDVVTEGQRFINPNLVVNGEVVDYQGRADLDPATGRRWYGPDIVNRHALDFIERHKGVPFFLYYPMLLVHDDHKPTPDTLPHSIFDNFDEVPHNRGEHHGNDFKYFPDMLAYMDKLIGRVVDKLDEVGVRENTLIVVLGDNGTKEIFAHILPDGRVYPGRKGGNADNGLHVPLILNQPGTIPVVDNGQVRVYDGLVDITDIYPTIAEAAGVEIPNADHLDGISFWAQVLGSEGEHRQSIHRWFIGNNNYKDEKHVVRFAFNKEFKRYAPSVDFPLGRFFDLRTDPLERVGDYKVELKWGLQRYSGLDVAQLSREQRNAYNTLGKVLDDNTIRRVSKLEIVPVNATMRVGETQLMGSRIYPQNATRSGVIWESSDPSVVSIDKFGAAKAIKPGTATITLFSWDDAEPLANNGSVSYIKGGLKAIQKVQVQ